MRYVYASRLSKIAECPASEAQCEGFVDSGGPPARFGTAFHQVLEVFGKHGEARALLELPSIAMTQGVDVDLMAEAFLANTFDPSQGRRPEFEVRGDVNVFLDEKTKKPVPYNETDSGFLYKIVGGIIDWRDEIEDGHWLVVDYKTGNPEYQADAEEALQVLAYGVATMMEKDAEKVTTQFYFPRLGHLGWTEPYTFERDEGEVIHGAIVDLVQRADKQWEVPVEDRRYSQGDHCTFCPGEATCPARLAPLAAAYNAISQTPVLKKDGTPGKRMKTELNFDLTPTNAVDVVYSVRYARKAIELLSSRTKELIEKVGPIPAGDGKVLDLRKSKRAQTLNLEHVASALKAAGISDEERLVVMHELNNLPRTSVERLDIYKEEV